MSIFSDENFFTYMIFVVVLVMLMIYENLLFFRTGRADFVLFAYCYCGSTATLFLYGCLRTNTTGFTYGTFPIFTKKSRWAPVNENSICFDFLYNIFLYSTYFLILHICKVNEIQFKLNVFVIRVVLYNCLLCALLHSTCCHCTQQRVGFVVVIEF